MGGADEHDNGDNQEPASKRLRTCRGRRLRRRKAARNAERQLEELEEEAAHSEESEESDTEDVLVDKATDLQGERAACNCAYTVLASNVPIHFTDEDIRELHEVAGLEPSSLHS